MTAIDLEKLKSGDREAFLHFWQEVQPLLYRLVGRYGGRSHDVEDIVQDTLFDIFNRLDLLRDIDSIDRLKAYTFRIARNKMMDRLRKEARRASSESPHDEPMLSVPDESLVAASEAIQHQELVQLLIETIKSLPEREQILVHDWLGGMTLQESATKLGCSIATAYRFRQRAMEQLRKTLEEKGVIK